MKTLIEKSIEIYGMGHPDTKTVFKIEDITLPENPTDQQIIESKEKEMNNKRILKDVRFKSLVVISGRTLTICFNYTENGEEKSGKLPIKIIKSDSELVIKQFILTEINNSLV
jgi:hypothetical protein